jgi:hypothetical protein
MARDFGCLGGEIGDFVSLSLELLELRPRLVFRPWVSPHPADLCPFVPKQGTLDMLARRMSRLPVAVSDNAWVAIGTLAVAGATLILAVATFLIARGGGTVRFELTTPCSQRTFGRRRRS